MTRGTATVHVRPVVDRERIDTLVDVQELLVELADDDAVRVLEVGRKRLPDRRSDSPNWGHVRAAGPARDDVAELFDDATYRTRTQGERHQSATRVAAEGTWELRREGRDTHLVLELEARMDDQDLLDALHLHPQARYVLNVKNPRAAGAAGLDDEDRAELPEHLQEVFDGNRWAPADPVELLDHVGVEFVLVPAEISD